MSKRKQDHIEALEGWCVVEAHIECSSCKKGTMLSSYDEPEVEAYRLGWREVGEQCLCPSCRRKRNIKNKKRRKQP